MEAFFNYKLYLCYNTVSDVVGSNVQFANSDASKDAVKAFLGISNEPLHGNLLEYVWHAFGKS